MIQYKNCTNNWKIREDTQRKLSLLNNAYCYGKIYVYSFYVYAYDYQFNDF